MDLFGTLESSCDSSLPAGNWARLSGSDRSLHSKFEEGPRGDQLSVYYSGDDGSAALCLAGNGGFFPKAGAMFVSDSNGEVTSVTVD